MDNFQQEFDTVVHDIKIEVHKTRAKEFLKGGKTVLEVLRGAMKVSGADVVYPKWLDTAERELQKIYDNEMKKYDNR